MPKFTIPVCRIGYSIKEIEVEADSKEQANELALEQAPNELFGSEHASDYMLEDEIEPENRILVHLDGGVIQGVFADYPSKVNVIIRDADNEGSERELAEEGKLFTEDKKFSNPDNKSTHRYFYNEWEETVWNWDSLETQPFANPVSVEEFDKYWNEISKPLDEK